MSYDRYIAIGRPLHYETLLGSRVCVHLAAAAWAFGFLTALLHTANTFSLPLCQGNDVDQFFCEVPQMLKLSCSTSYLREVWVNVIAFSLSFGCFVLIVVSYVQIFRAVLSIPSQQGRHKAFATCLPHLAVVSLFTSTGSIAYLKPPSLSSSSLDLVISILYSVVPPKKSVAAASVATEANSDLTEEMPTDKLEVTMHEDSTTDCGSSDLEGKGTDVGKLNSADSVLQLLLEEMECLEAHGYGIFTTRPLLRAPAVPAAPTEAAPTNTPLSPTEMTMGWPL
ncbi:olfactory receptor 14J1-like [Dryobates pubescens]|uniref:olfactory receptor 14J1-like n=1 Tax=Dryobates pubescens TaxID=118200 RepID=UPI0023B89887|nr:olfactory receptor 14J1-like [Dryobates pubescens]